MRVRAYLLGAVPLFSDMVAAYCLFLFLTHFTADRTMAFSFPLYLVCGFASLAVNRLLLKKCAQLWVFALVNAGLIAAAEVGMFLAPHDIEGFFPILFAGLVFAYPALRGLLLTHAPPSDGTQLTYVELSFMGTAAFLFIQITEFKPGVGATLCCLVALALNVITLAWLRSAGNAKNRISTGSRRQPVLILALVAAAILIVVALVGLVVLPASADSLVAAGGAVAGGLYWVWRHIWQFFLLVGRFLVWLASLLPGLGEAAPLPMEEAPGAGGGEAMELAEMPAWMGLLLPGILVAVALVVVTVLVIRHRRLRLSARAEEEALVQQKSGAPTLWQLLRAALARLLARIAFLRALAAARNTAAGVAVRLELLCARRGAPRRPGQTPREFLLALYERTPPDRPLAREGFLALAGAVDRRCFGGGDEEHLPREQVRAMMRVALAASGRQTRKHTRSVGESGSLGNI